MCGGVTTLTELLASGLTYLVVYLLGLDYAPRDTECVCIHIYAIHYVLVHCNNMINSFAFIHRVFVKLYISGSDSVGYLQRLDEAFRGVYSSGSSYIAPFLGQSAINVSAVAPNGTNLLSRTVNDSVHPDCTDCPDGDPTLLAVVVGTYVGMYMYTCCDCKH